MAKKRIKKRKIFTMIGFIVFFIGLMVFLFSGDNFVILQELFKEDVTKEEVRASLENLGFKGYFTIGILSMLQVVLTILPAEPTQVMAGVAFGLWKGGLICLAGVFIGNTLIYVLYKIYGDRLEEFFEKNAEFDFEAARHSPKIIAVVFILYFLPAIPYGLICFFSASLNLKYPKYILLTTLGSIPSILIGVGLGHLAIASSWILSLCVFAVLLVLLILLYKYKSAVFKKVNEFMNSKKEYSSKTTVKKYNPFIYNAAAAGSVLFFDTRMKLILKNNVGKLERPAIVLCNHGSFIDFVYAARLLKKEKPHFVVARLYFYHKKLGNLLRKVGCFPKSMFTADIENAKNCMRVLSQDGVLAMMPEARLSTVGKYEGIQEKTYRFIQRAGVPVYVIRVRGDYFASPKWGDKLRKGARVEASLDKLFDKDETKTLDLEQVRQRIDEALSYNEFTWLQAHPDYTYKSKTLAVGLENILTLCPECKKHYTLKTDGLTISCSECGFTRTLNNRYGFTVASPFENFAQWYDWQKSEMEREMRENPDFKLESAVTLKHASKDGKTMLCEAGKGVCVLDKTGLCYRGEEFGQQIEKRFALSDIYRLLFGAGEDFEIYEGDEIWYFIPEEKRSCVDWYIASELLKKIYE